jgi:hypothetical protein
MSTSEQLEISLRKRVKLGEEEITSIRVREPTAAELLAADQLEGTTADIKVVSLVAGMPEALVRKLAASDLLRAADFIADVLKAATEDFAFDPAVDELVLVLRKSVTYDNASIDKLKLREPSAGELETFNKLKGQERDIVAVATVAGVHRHAAEKMLAGDVARGMKFINSFLQGGQTAGGS